MGAVHGEEGRGGGGDEGKVGKGWIKGRMVGKD